MAKVGVDLTPELWLVKVKLFSHSFSFFLTVLTLIGNVWSSSWVVSIAATYVDVL